MCDTYMNGDDVTRGVYSRNTGLYQVLSQVTDVALMFFTQMPAFFTAQNLKIQPTSHEQLVHCYFVHDIVCCMKSLQKFSTRLIYVLANWYKMAELIIYLKYGIYSIQKSADF